MHLPLYTHPKRRTQAVNHVSDEHPTVGLCLGPYGGPTGGTVSCERGNPVIREPACRLLIMCRTRRHSWRSSTRPFNSPSRLTM